MLQQPLRSQLSSFNSDGSIALHIVKPHFDKFVFSSDTKNNAIVNKAYCIAQHDPLKVMIRKQDPNKRTSEVLSHRNSWDRQQVISTSKFCKLCCKENKMTLQSCSTCQWLHVVRRVRRRCRSIRLGSSLLADVQIDGASDNRHWEGGHRCLDSRWWFYVVIFPGRCGNRS